MCEAALYRCNLLRAFTCLIYESSSKEHCNFATLGGLALEGARPQYRVSSSRACPAFFNAKSGAETTFKHHFQEPCSSRVKFHDGQNLNCSGTSVHKPPDPHRHEYSAHTEHAELSSSDTESRPALQNLEFSRVKLFAAGVVGVDTHACESCGA